MSSPQYRRILLKLSGEALKGNEPAGFDSAVLDSLSTQIKDLHELGVELGIVIGGGNFFRGAQVDWMPRTSADRIGMMATMMNGIALREAFLAKGLGCALFSAVPLPGVIEMYDQHAVNRAFQNKQVVVFSGGTGHPFFTTDTAAALRAREIEADVLIKATQVDGVYDADPHKHPNAKRYDRLSYLDVLEKGLRVMDATSVSFCREYQIPMYVMRLQPAGQLRKAVLGDAVGTLVSDT